MKINKEFVLKNLITICCVASILLLLLPFGSVTAEVKSSFVNANSSASFSGFDAIFGQGSVLIAWLLLLCPALLIGMNYIKQIEKYKSLLAIVLPVVSTVAAVITMLTAGVSASASGGGASMETSTSPEIGFFLLLVAYIGTLVAGAMTFYGLKLSKEGLAEFSNKLKEEGASSLGSLKELGQKAGEGVANAAQKVKSSGEASGQEGAVTKPVKRTNINQTNDVLAVISQLSEMKDKGILTDEEFAEKKKELLAQI